MPSPKYPKLFFYNERRTRYVVYAIWKTVFPGHFDPVVEIFAKVKNEYTSLSNLEIGKEHQSEEIMRRYHIGVQYANNKGEDFDTVEDRFAATAPKVIERLFSELDKWARAENGQTAILKCVTSEAAHNTMDAYLESVSLREHKLSKEERRQAYLQEHPEHARTARPRNKSANQKKA